MQQWAARSQSQHDGPAPTAKDQENQDIFLDINFFRDLGPLSRQLNLIPPKPKSKEQKELRNLQKKVLNNMIDLEPSQKNINDDVFLLALSGQVPIDKLLLRLQTLKGIEINGQVDGAELMNHIPEEEDLLAETRRESLMQQIEGEAAPEV